MKIAGLNIKKSKRQLAREQARADMSFARKWPFAFMVGGGLGVLALIDQGLVSTDAGLDSPCRVQVVTVEKLVVRDDADAGADKVGELAKDELRGATTTVRNGYRQLSDGNWALSQYLRPLPPVENCTAK